MEQRHARRTRTLPAHLRGFVMEGTSSSQDPGELSRLAAVVRLDHSYSLSKKAGRPRDLEERYLKNAAVLPSIRPAASVSSVTPALEESVSMHGRSVQGYQEIYRSVVEPMMKTRCGGRRPYSLKLGLKIKQRLWEALSCPSLVETEQPDGCVLITESFSTNNRSPAPRIQVNISEEPRRKKPRH